MGKGGNSEKSRREELAEKQARVQKRQRRGRAVKITAVVLVIALIIGCFTYYRSITSTDSVSTAVATYSSIAKAVTVSMFVVRDEEYIYNTSSGSAVDAVSSGSRVAKGDTIAYVFSSSESAANVARINEIDELLEYYESISSLSSTTTVTDTSSYDSKINSAIEEFLDSTENGDYSGLVAVSDDLRDSIFARQYALGGTVDVADKIEALTLEREELVAATGSYSTITASSPGYYISGADGYENTLSYDDVDDWTIDDVTAALSSSPQEVGSTVYGRIVTDYKWYLTCVVSSSEAVGLTEGSEYTIAFPDSSAENITAEVIRMEKSGTSEVLLVFECGTMSEELSTLRIETAQIYISTYSGLVVYNTAIRELNGYTGVYVLSGSRVRFRRFYILYSNDEYSIVQNSENDDEEAVTSEDGETYTYSFLKQYDTYLLGGTDLYDGKYIG